MSITGSINQQLNHHPGIKRKVKRVYQRAGYAASKKTASEGAIRRVSPDDGHEYFFGYYDKSPWDRTDRYMLCLKARDTWSDVSPRETARVILIDTARDYAVTEIGITHAWNVQQGCMAQWLGPDFKSHILYNDCRDGAYCAVIVALQYEENHIRVVEERVIPKAVYTVSTDGRMALTLDFSRLYRLRPGYGYYNVPEQTAKEKLPDTACVWRINLETGAYEAILKYTDLARFEPRSEMQGAEHKVNHLMLSPDGRRFMVQHRWFQGERKYTRLVTADIDGSNLYNLSDDDMVSHCFWQDNTHILAFERKKGQGPGYYLMTDRTQQFVRYWSWIDHDGHPSFSPDGQRIVFDCYPDRARMAAVYAANAYQPDGSVTTLARVFAPFKYDNDTRCDLHPRWNRAGDMICFDAVYEGHRGLYVVPDARPSRPLADEDPGETIPGLVSCVIPTYKRADTVTRAIDSVLNQSYEKVEVLVVDDNEPGDAYSQALKEALLIYEDEPRVRYIGQTVHKNGAVARNVGTRAARGEWVAYLDDDDEWLSGKVLAQIEASMYHPDADLFTCLWIRMKGGREKRRCPAYSAEGLEFKVFARQVSVFTSTVMIRKKAVYRFGGYDESLLRHQDLQFLIDAAAVSKAWVVPKHLVLLHADSDINRPDTARLIAAKQAFFKSTDGELRRFSKRDQQRIRDAHYYEVVFSALKNKKPGAAARYVLKAGVHPQSLKDLLARMRDRT